MFSPNPRRPLTRRQTARVVFAGIILAWATQILIQQWGYGAEPVILAQNQTAERFIPPATARSVRLELRSEATITGSDLHLRQVARWSDDDAAVFAPIADLVLGQVGAGAPFRAISLDEVKSTLRDAGVNLASIHFVGATKCIVNRGDVEYNEANALEQWVQTKSLATPAGGGPTTAPSLDVLALATDSNLSVPARIDPAAEEPATQNLRSVLIADLCERLKLRREQVQVTFKPADEKLLNLAYPQFRFELDPVRVRNLGEVAWNVTLVAGEDRQKASVVATARAWQSQVIVSKALAYKQVIRDDDVTEKRILADRLSDDPIVTRAQVVGQQASRDLKPGTLLTAKLIDPVPLVRPGQFVTITLSQGAIQVKTVARALDGGSYGQTIRVKNETTKDIFQVVITGAQTAVVGATEVSTAQPGN